MEGVLEVDVELILIDNEGWAMTFNTIQELEGYVEWTEVRNDEYRVCDKMGFVYGFELLPNRTFRVKRTNMQDKFLPVNYLNEYARTLKLNKNVVESLISSSDNIIELFDVIETIREPMLHTTLCSITNLTNRLKNWWKGS